MALMLARWLYAIVSVVILSGSMVINNISGPTDALNGMFLACFFGILIINLIKMCYRNDKYAGSVLWKNLDISATHLDFILKAAIFSGVLWKYFMDGKNLFG